MKPRPGRKTRASIVSTVLSVGSTALALSVIYTGCGHDLDTPSSGYTTVYFGNRVQQSMQAAQSMDLMRAFESSAKVGVAALPSGGSAGLVAIANLVNGGVGANVLYPVSAASTASWTLPNGTYYFSALGFGDSGNNDPFCGLALGDDGNRGDAIVLNGVSKTVDILMGGSPAATGGSSGPSGTTPIGSPNAPTCGMTPFMQPDPAGTGGASGYANTFSYGLASMGVCNGALPPGGDLTFAAATSCSGLNGPAGSSGAHPPGNASVQSLMVEFQSFNSFNGAQPALAVPPGTTAGPNIITGSCVGASGTGYFPTPSGQNIRFPTGSNTVAAGGPAGVGANSIINYSLPGIIALYSGASCTGFLGEFLVKPGLANMNGSTGTGFPGPMQAIFIDSSGNITSADTKIGFAIFGSSVPTQVKLWFQYP